MGLDAGADREWLLYWTARDQPVPCSRVPVLAGWADLDQREADAGLTARHPILIDPQYRIDPVLARFLTASRFTWLAEGTREAYAKDYRLFFSFLWQRGKYWHEADPDDLLDWEAWRRRNQPGRRIGGSKWQRELAALRLLYEWAEKKGHIAQPGAGARGAAAGRRHGDGRRPGAPGRPVLGCEMGDAANLPAVARYRPARLWHVRAAGPVVAGPE